MSRKLKNTFIVLAPSDPYFLSILSMLICKLSAAYPDYLVLIVPVWGIKFGNSFSVSNRCKFLSRIRSSLGYYKNQLLLNNQLKYFFCQHGLTQFPKNTFLVNHTLLRCRIAMWSLYNLKYDLSSFAASLEDYKIGPIKVGDLIVDTFLRFRPSASFCSSDSFVDDLLRLSHSYLSFFDYLFCKYNVKAVFGSYTTYVQHGIPHRLCQYKNVESYTFGGATRFYRQHRPSSFLSHAGDHTKYSLVNLNMSPSILEQAETSLVNRIYGRKDPTISYMQKFSTVQLVNISVAGKHIIFLHDFFDSPHIYRWMLHHDFYHWITDTLNTLNTAGLEVFIKPHPNQSIESSEIVASLKAQYSSQLNITWLSEEIANAALLQQSPRLVVSVYGSIIPESAYCNVRSISAGDHPAINCNLSYDPSDLVDYHHKLLNPELISVPDKRNAIAFLAQHMPEHSGNTIPSLINYLGSTFSEIDNNPSILDASSTKRFLAESLDALLDSHSFYDTCYGQ
jgi:hypothetical protein